jgi:hypothetical protein
MTRPIRLAELLAILLVACGGGAAATHAVETDPYTQQAARRATEGRDALTQIAQRQESYRAEFGQYAFVSEPDAWWPTDAPGPHDQAEWGMPPEGWTQLGFAPPTSGVPFQAQVIAGLPGSAPADGEPERDDFWFIARVRGHFEDPNRITVLERRSWETDGSRNE